MISCLNIVTAEASMHNIQNNETVIKNPNNYTTSKQYKNLLQSIGNTPLVKLDVDVPCTVLAKLEFLNPGASLKPRCALYMIEQAEKNGLLKPGGTIIEASSGNQGIAAAMIGALKGYKVIITVSQKISAEKLATIKAYGAQVIMFPPAPTLEHPDSYQSKAWEIHKNTPNSYMLNQYYNPVNAEGHYMSLGPEIWEGTDGQVTHYFAAAGSGGHVSGVGRYLKERNPLIKVIGLDAANSWYSAGGNAKPYKIEGLGIDADSPVLDKKTIDLIIPVTDEDGLLMTKMLARKYGILAGPSSGAVAHGAFEYAKNLMPTDIVVMIFGDSGTAYLSKGFYD